MIIKYLKIIGIVEIISAIIYAIYYFSIMCIQGLFAIPQILTLLAIIAFAPAFGICLFKLGCLMEDFDSEKVRTNQRITNIKNTIFELRSKVNKEDKKIK